MILPVGTAGGVTRQTEPEADNTVTRIDVDANGSARWTIQVRTRLDTDERVEEYEAFQTRFRNDTSRYLDPFRDRMRGVVSNGANVTGREMRATNFTASTSVQEVPRRWGVVTYRFTWTNFGTRTDGEIAVGDVFQDGFFISSDDTLTIEAPAEYEISRIEPAPDSRNERAVTWVGRADFSNEHPQVVFAPAGATAGTQSSSSWIPFLFGQKWPGFVVGVVVSFGIVTIAYTVYRRRDDSAETHQPPTAVPEEPSNATTGPATGPIPQSDNSQAEEQVMTDEERVLALLEDNGGRMRQATIDDEFDWSASKTSRVIGKLVDDGSVEKRRIGRENLIDLVDDE
ncbi:helix-turn-helix transcriptional regulator [Natrinema salaciae]|uniref:IclR helix-turn-helix domain-containing protein n=1 Tax=Natrinema salaciae TaxID=1186196 RepID=A0A1H9FN92_9EURY|nr:DUF4897 domain-containing protein [Natrinema salaciae]SEQ39460.1 hypothetical protein SAMN04489841_1632 [Natrinema salaciae]